MKTIEELNNERAIIIEEIATKEKEISYITKTYLSFVKQKRHPESKINTLPNGTRIMREFKAKYVCKDEKLRKEKAIEANILKKEIDQLQEEKKAYDRLIEKAHENDILGIAPSKQKLTGQNNVTSVDTRIHEIINFVSSWKNIEGTYSQNKLAEKLHINKGTLSKFLNKIIYTNDTQKTVKQLLIKKVRESLRILEEREKTKEGIERKARLNHFFECLVTEQPKIDRTQGKRKTSYYNPHEEN